ncbi:putative threonine synthase [Candidatus Desulfarcum epimagneticum]|uniref:Threonine synthase n=1 Tax=uncultured Desulfobacteraceae bacterium TaxID=218296 RepID=A0A484HH87_9BACT|nr:putative threonine synthase [uncultured Desulfobacteraceae bacterium]
MRIHDFPQDIRPFVIPGHKGEMVCECLACGAGHGVDALIYTCPACGHVLLIRDKKFDDLKKISGDQWRRIFDYRKMLSRPAFKGIYRYHEFIGPVIPEEAIVWLGEGHTPLVAANEFLREKVGMAFYFKNDGQNPSASFKDRGMASAMSYIRHLLMSGRVSDVLAICASTGDTSAAAALYASYLRPSVKSATILPHKKVTSQQLLQPLSSGSAVFEVPGVFDDCMKVVEDLSDRYNVALLNSKNPWRILGQESYSYEIAQDLEYEMENKVVALPVGNAGNITAVMSGFLKFHEAGIIDALPKIIGVQSEHADPVWRYYAEPDEAKRRFRPVTVRPSVAQAAMIGNPVSMPRVVKLAGDYDRASGKENVFFVRTAEQAIMDWELVANQNGHIACTQGGESLAGLVEALRLGIVGPGETAILDSTAHALKFSGFTQRYYENRLDPEYKITPSPDLINRPHLIRPPELDRVPEPGRPLEGEEFARFVQAVSERIAERLGIKEEK